MRVAASVLVVLWLCAGANSSAEVRSDFAMESDPDMKLPVRARVFIKDYKPYWIEALARPEAETQRQTADVIADAYRLGMRDLEWVHPLLTSIVASDATKPSTRFAAARTLILLEVRDAAPVLYAASKGSSELRQLVEPALAKWRFPPIAAEWRERIESRETRLNDLLLALQAVAITGDEQAVPALLAIVDDPFRLGAVRLRAAQSVGQLKTSGLEPRAQSLARGTGPILSRLCAVALLWKHEGAASEQELVALAQDSEPTVAWQALARLNETRPELVVPLAEKAMQNGDPKVREQGARAYVLLPTPERIPTLTRLLDDPHPAVRGYVCDALLRLAGMSELDGPVRASASTMLGADGWRGQEQSALLLGALGHKPAGPRLVALLESPRAEVMIATAWALRKLALPETLPAIFDRATRQTKLHAESLAPEGSALQVAHLFEAMGRMKHAPARPLMEKYIANKGFGEMPRCAAIWALGLLHEGAPDEKLVDAFVGRITESLDVRPVEHDRVRYMSAVSLVRMRAESSLEEMRGLLTLLGDSNPASPAVAARWTIKEFTGEPGLPPDPFNIVTDWFLEPLALKGAPAP